MLSPFDPSWVARRLIPAILGDEECPESDDGIRHRAASAVARARGHGSQEHHGRKDTETTRARRAKAGRGEEAGET
jgi:hypothetical protein